MHYHQTRGMVYVIFGSFFLMFIAGEVIIRLIGILGALALIHRGLQLLGYSSFSFISNSWGRRFPF